MKTGISRRAFIRQSGLGLTAFLAAPALWAQDLNQASEAQDLVRLAVKEALKQGAVYADARIGHCRLEGAQQDFSPISLLNSDLMGMRIGQESGWKFLLFNDLNEKAVKDLLSGALKEQAPTEPASDLKVWASFDPDKRLAFHSSDPSIEEQFSIAWMRYHQAQGKGKSHPRLLYCDILSDHSHA